MPRLAIGAEGIRRQPHANRDLDLDGAGALHRRGLGWPASPVDVLLPPAPGNQFPFQPPTNLPPPRCHAPPSSRSPPPRSRSRRRRAQRVACGGRGSGSTGVVGGAGPSRGAWRRRWRRPARRRTACCCPRRGPRRLGVGLQCSGESNEEVKGSQTGERRRLRTAGSGQEGGSSGAQELVFVVLQDQRVAGSQGHQGPGVDLGCGWHLAVVVLIEISGKVPSVQQQKEELHLQGQQQQQFHGCRDATMDGLPSPLVVLGIRWQPPFSSHCTRRPSPARGGGAGAGEAHLAPKIAAVEGFYDLHGTVVQQLEVKEKSTHVMCPSMERSSSSLRLARPVVSLSDVVKCESKSEAVKHISKEYHIMCCNCRQ